MWPWKSTNAQTHIEYYEGWKRVAVHFAGCNDVFACVAYVVAVVGNPLWQTLSRTHRNAWRIFLDGPPPAACGPAGAFSFISRTRTMLHRNNRFKSIDRQTGTIRTYMCGASLPQHLGKGMDISVARRSIIPKHTRTQAIDRAE